MRRSRHTLWIRQTGVPYAGHKAGPEVYSKKHDTAPLLVHQPYVIIVPATHTLPSPKDVRV